MNPVTEFTVNGLLSSGLGNESKRRALERLTAMAKFELVKLRTEPPKSNYDFSTLPGIDDICVKTIIPYLSNDVQALVCLFARTTKRFLNVSSVQFAYYEIVLPMKYGNNPGNELMYGCKYGCENNALKLNCLHAFDGQLDDIYC